MGRMWWRYIKTEKFNWWSGSFASSPKKLISFLELWTSLRVYVWAPPSKLLMCVAPLLVSAKSVARVFSSEVPPRHWVRALGTTRNTWYLGTYQCFTVYCWILNNYVFDCDGAFESNGKDWLWYEIKVLFLTELFLIIFLTDWSCYSICIIFVWLKIAYGVFFTQLFFVDGT